MGLASEKLISLLKLNQDKLAFSRAFDFKLYPFFTRNPERAKFKNGFAPILGAMARYSLGLKTEYKQEDYDISSIYNNIDFLSNMKEKQKEYLLNRIFGLEKISSIKHPHFINHYPLSEGKEKKGEIAIALYLSQIFNLKKNQDWYDFIGNKSTSNLIEKILVENVNNIPVESENNIFIDMLDDLFIYKESDLKFLLKNKDFALKYLDMFFAFYYFQYILQTVLNVDYLNNAEKGVCLYPLYYTLDTEKLTRARKTNNNGFKRIKEISKYTLVNENLLGYINILINMINNDTKFYSFTEIFNLPFKVKNLLNNELQQVLLSYSEKTKKEEKISDKLKDNILLFKKWLSEDIANETTSRFNKSLEEIGNLYFLKNRGQLGKTLVLKKDMLILLTALIVKEEKMLIKDVFEGFERRGVYLDRYTKEDILNFYEKLNILDKKSDSGEVKYVKPVL